MLAASALQTPQLLELSGVSSAALRSDLDMPALVDNGNGMWARISRIISKCGFSIDVEEGVETMDVLAWQDSIAIGEAMGMYMTEKSGPFATGGNFRRGGGDPTSCGVS